MKSKAYITHLDSHIPENEFVFERDLKDDSTFEKTLFNDKNEFVEFAKSTLGGMTSFRLENELSMEEMAENLLDKNLDEGNIIPEDINYIIIATDFNDNLVKFGHYVQHEFEMPKANVLRISGNYCANIDAAIGIASMLVKNDEGKEKNALIISGTKFKPNATINERLVANYGVMGDSVSVVVVSNSAENALLCIQDQKTVTKGVLHDGDLAKDNAILHFQSYTECLELLFEGKKESIKEDIDGVILHNSNHMLIEQVIKSYGIDLEKIDTTNQGTYGHLGTSDLILNLKTHLENNEDSKLLLSLNLGANGTYVGTLFEKVS